MDLLCPDINYIIRCNICGDQTLPPFRLCMSSHPVCGPCFKYLKRCTCGYAFATGPHSMLDWVVTAMRLQCKYCNAAGDGVGSQWFDVQELREHYRTGCRKNVFRCPLRRCGHVGHYETMVEHFETAHGPNITKVVAGADQPPGSIELRIKVPLP